MAAGHSPSSAGCPQRDVHDDYSWSIAMTDRSASRPVLAIRGGTGDLGTGLARRWAQAGYTVVIGSRTADRAEAAAQELAAWLSERGQAGDQVRGTDNLSAAQARSEEHTSELQSRGHLVCRLLLEKKKN